MPNQNRHVLFGQIILAYSLSAVHYDIFAQLRKDIFHSNRRILIIMLMVI
ncbi:MAG: hypothetical protein R2847_03165 [Bacteroidia bacterium]